MNLTSNVNAFLKENLLVVKSRRDNGKSRRRVKYQDTKPLPVTERQSMQTEKNEKGIDIHSLDIKRLLELHRAERIRLLEVGTTSLDEMGFPVIITPQLTSDIEYIDNKIYVAYQQSLAKMSSKEAHIKYIPSSTPTSAPTHSTDSTGTDKSALEEEQEGKEEKLVLEWQHIIECFCAQADAALTRIGSTRQGGDEVMLVFDHLNISPLIATDHESDSGNEAVNGLTSSTDDRRIMALMKRNKIIVTTQPALYYELLLLDALHLSQDSTETGLHALQLAHLKSYTPPLLPDMSGRRFNQHLALQSAIWNLYTYNAQTRSDKHDKQGSNHNSKEEQTGHDLKNDHQQSATDGIAKDLTISLTSAPEWKEYDQLQSALFRRHFDGYDDKNSSWNSTISHGTINQEQPGECMARWMLLLSALTFRPSMPLNSEIESVVYSILQHMYSHYAYDDDDDDDEDEGSGTNMRLVPVPWMYPPLSTSVIHHCRQDIRDVNVFR